MDDKHLKLWLESDIRLRIVEQSHCAGLYLTDKPVGYWTGYIGLVAAEEYRELAREVSHV